MLLQVRFDGMLGFPGGLIAAGEATVDGLNRELAEEVGLDLDRLKIMDSDWIMATTPDRYI